MVAQSEHTMQIITASILISRFNLVQELVTALLIVNSFQGDNEAAVQHPNLLSSEGCGPS